MAKHSSSELITMAQQALMNRKAYILSNLETVTLKSVRRLLEGDLKLPSGSLDMPEVKAFINAKTDEVINEDPDTQTQPFTPVMADPSEAGSANPDETEATSPARQHNKPKDKKKKKRQSHGNRQADGHKPKAGSGKENKEKKAKDKQQEDKKRKQSKHKEQPDKGKGKPSRVNQLAEEQSDSDDGGSWKRRDAKRHKTEKSESAGGAATKGEPAAKIVSRRVEKLKNICRQATIRIAPQIYMKNKDEASLIAALEELLGKHGLSSNSESRAIERVKKSLNIARDLDGINADNIIEEAGRRPRRSAAEAARSSYRAMLQPPKVDDSDEDESEETGEGNNDENDDDGDDVAADEDDEGQEQPASTGKKQKQTSKASRVDSEEEESSDEEVDEKDLGYGLGSEAGEDVIEDELQNSDGAPPAARKCKVVHDDISDSEADPVTDSARKRMRKGQPMIAA